jgi:hypothetical protein
MNIKKLSIVSLIIALCLIGCAQPKRVWHKSGGSLEEFQRDKYQCTQESRVSWSGGGSGDIGLIIMFSSKSQAEKKSLELFEMCMEARGYNWHIMQEVETIGGGGSSSGGSVSVSDFSGTWSGPYNSSRFGAHAVILNFQQNGGSVTGKYQISPGGLGTFSGTVSGNTVTGTITVTTPGCSGSLSGTAILNSSTTMSVSFTGSTTCGGQESVTGNLTKR